MKSVSIEEVVPVFVIEPVRMGEVAPVFFMVSVSIGEVAPVSFMESVSRKGVLSWEEVFDALERRG